MHVLLADAIDDSAVELIREADHTVDSEPSLTTDTLPAAIGAADVLVVRSTKVPAPVLEAGKNLSLVVRAGAGTENIDVEAASGLGIHVCNVPGRNAVAVAELTVGLLLAVDRHIAAGTADLRAGVWNKKRYSQADGLMGRTIGIIGLGEIGLSVAERAKAFGLTILGQRKPGPSSRTEARIRSIGIRLVDTVEELVAASDIISLHVPGGDATRGMINAELLARFRDDAILLNTSRGDCVDEPALLAAMDARGIRAGVDVFCNEPAAGDTEVDSALAQHPNVVGTHHIGASTRQAQLAVAAGVAETVNSFASGTVANCVNLAPRGTGSHSITIRHYDRVGVLAAVFGVLRGGGLNVQHMENQVFEGGKAAVATIDVSDAVNDELRMQLLELPNVLGVSVARQMA